MPVRISKNRVALENIPLNEAMGADIVSASSIDIGSSTGNFINITGTTTITALGTASAGTRRILKFSGVLTLTYNATSLILPGATNITTASGDTASLVSLGSGNWICTYYQPAGGLAFVAANNTFSKAQRGAVVALSDGATITPDFSTGNNFSVTLGGNRTLANPTNIVVGQSGIFAVTQDGTGSRTLSYGTYYKFAAGTAPTLTTTAAAVDYLAYYVETATRIYISFIGNVS